MYAAIAKRRQALQRRLERIVFRLASTGRRGGDAPNPEPAQTTLGDAVRRHLRPDFFFVNIGANDGMTNDPIYPFLVQYGWRGIAVEPVPHVFQRLLANYQRFPGVVCEHAAIASCPRPFHYIGEGAVAGQTWADQVGSLRLDYTRKTIALFRTFQFQGPVPDDMQRHVVTTEIPCLTFGELMQKHRVERVDFLNIDAEGCDYEVFCGIDFSRYRPAILCIEVSELSPSEKHHVEAELRRLGYVFLERFDLFSSVYVRDPDTR